jgi:hypothetical protein
MKIALTGLIALSTLAFAFAEDSNPFGDIPAAAAPPTTKLLAKTPPPPATPEPSPNPSAPGSAHVVIQNLTQNVTQNNLTVVQPTPAPTPDPPTPAPTPEQIQIERTANARNWIIRFVQDEATGSPNEVLVYYSNAGPVHYFDDGWVSRDHIFHDLVSYDNKWVSRSYQVTGDGVSIQWLDSNVFQADYTVGFYVQNRQGKIVVGHAHDTVIATYNGGITNIRTVIVNHNA